MQNQYSYTILNPTDTEVMFDLLTVFGKAFEDEEMYQKNTPSRAYLKERLADKHCIVIAALKEDEVVGGLIAYVLPKLEQEKSEIYLYDLAVDENYRRQGIATKLIEELKIVGKKLGAWVIFVQADAVDEGAIKLYESLSQEKEAPYHFDILIP
jgi:aminoglycoside 3-N-acetyltransferase I